MHQEKNIMLWNFSRHEVYQRHKLKNEESEWIILFPVHGNEKGKSVILIPRSNSVGQGRVVRDKSVTVSMQIPNTRHVEWSLVYY